MKVQAVRSICSDLQKSSEIKLTEVQIGIINAIASLPERYRKIILMRDIEGLSVSQIAQALQLNEAKAQKRLDRARIRLQNRLVKLL